MNSNGDNDGDKECNENDNSNNNPNYYKIILSLCSLGGQMINGTSHEHHQDTNITITIHQ